ncbi:MAG TPA: hypothetical protein VFD67_03065, partial [Gemmatimonadaceae bacterium]|nr:hypothetical protein [Gemmatimonadaceae bacterium]
MSVRYSALIALVVMGSTARAQVGYPPAKSPYMDLVYSQEITPIFGYYVGRDDPAGVVPGNGTLVGLHYEWRAGGPAHLTGEVARIGSSRTILDPSKPASTRNLGEHSWPLWSADFGLGMSLTGARSWHSLVPMVKAGVGFMSDFKSADVGDFKYGTRFALTWGAAMRFVPGGRYQLRADFSNRLTSIRYPDVYFRPTVAGVTPILAGKKDQSVWRNNPSISIGISYLFSR